MKVAVFPIEVRGTMTVSEGLLDDLRKAIEEVPDVVVSHSWYPDVLGGASLAGAGDNLEGLARTGSRRIPNVVYVREKGKALGTDVVLLISVIGSSANLDFEGWTVAVASGRVIEVRPAGSSLSNMHRLIIDGAESLVRRARAGG
jgi:hypothetical protein